MDTNKLQIVRGISKTVGEMVFGRYIGMMVHSEQKVTIEKVRNKVIGKVILRLVNFAVRELTKTIRKKVSGKVIDLKIHQIHYCQKVIIKMVKEKILRNFILKIVEYFTQEIISTISKKGFGSNSEKLVG